MTGISSSIPRWLMASSTVKAVNAGHVDIQQHNGDAGGVLFQQAQAVLAGCRFGSVELAVQHLAEQHPVHGRVVHDEHTLAAVGGLQGVRLRLTLGDHGVFWMRA